jgi:dUTPase
MNIIRLAPPTYNELADIEDLAAIEDFAILLTILLAQPDADTAIQQMHRVAQLIVCHARAIQSRVEAGTGRCA